MSREDAHKLLDRVLEVGYCGEFIFNCFKGGVTQVKLHQVAKNANEVMMVTVA